MKGGAGASTTRRGSRWLTGLTSVVTRRRPRWSRPCGARPRKARSSAEPHTLLASRNGSSSGRPMPRFLQQLLRRIESRALILVIGAAGGFWAFFNIAGEMNEGETQAVDKHFLLALRNPANPSDPIGSRSFQEAMRDVTALGGVTVMTLVAVVGVLAFLMHGRRWHAAILAITVLLADMSSEVLKNLYGRPRPDLVPHGSYVYSASFPSGHSTLSAATFLTLATLIASLEPNRGTKIMLYVLAVML